ncbi:B/F/G family RNA polymerase sigma-70 factor [Carbonactinospora thermoautotrophica]|uniref:RNA polymerase sigma factor SigF n=1 Tax=Carbonactinospora thermoautotrophica TaxID=1469144 RepID=UPI003555F8ED|nr:B/F/G family RNA polymerase sigma-70 factor [Carbonactinospora thermoautotrophica]
MTAVPLARERLADAPKPTCEELFGRMAELPEDDPERARLREYLIESQLPLARQLALRFANRGESMDDLIQVAMLGLVKAVDGFDPGYGTLFSTYAVPVIVGEIKRHFRDRTWAVRVPRRLQELRQEINKASSELTLRLGHAPTVAELAQHLGVSEDEIIEGLDADNAYSTLSLDQPAPSEDKDDGLALTDTLGADDDALEGVEYRESLRPLLEKLPEREKKILLLRFFGNMTQSQIGERIGISQMHVSRLLAKTLAQLRAELLKEE